MKLQGKILHYSPEKGAGIIMTKDHRKFPFSVNEWDDYDALPEAGFEVEFVLQNLKARHVVIRDAQADFWGTPKQQNAEAPVAPTPPPRPLHIRPGISVVNAIKEYFEQIERDIAERSQYKKAKGQLDFLKIRRFLFTMFNNLSELDTHFITPQIRTIHDDLIQMSRVYDDYKIKTTYPDVAYDKVFLSRQSDYVQIRQDTQSIIGELQRYRVSEQFLEQSIEEKEEVLARTLRVSTQFKRLDENVKDLRSNYVDVVHMIASLEEQHRVNAKMMSEFEKKHRGEFLERFTEASRKYREQILHILNAQSFIFDAEIWAQAKHSKVIKNFFHESRIEGDYCAKTYLKYYLNSLDKEKISSEQKGLFDLYEYLESLEHDTVAIVVNSVDDALRIKYLFRKVKAPHVVDSFIDEKKAIQWAEENRATVLIIEERVGAVSARQFIREYKKRVSLQPKTVLLGQVDAKNGEQQLYDKVVSKNAPESELYAAIKAVMTKDENG